MKRKHVFWLAGFFLLIFAALGFVAAKTIYVDPFFHFHKPKTDGYFYLLNNERSQNNGIIRHFDYSGLITGTSMAENFKTSEAEALWGGTFIKAPFSGGTYKEINDNIEAALRYNSNLKTVIRGLDMSKFIENKDRMRTDLGEFPAYLYDDNVFNDVHYFFNRDVIFNRVYPMTKGNDTPDFVPGITSFDQYANWMSKFHFGKDNLFPNGINIIKAGNPVHITEEEAEIVKGTIEQNLIAVASKNPDVTFYYFFTPYSAQWWMNAAKDGTVYKQIEAERLIIEGLLPYSNIKLFSFNCRFDLITDLNHYKDAVHYAEWINSMILRYMYDNQYLLTAENYEDYLEKELQFYTTYDYTRMNDQPDYTDDYYAAFLLEKEEFGQGYSVDLKDDCIELMNATLIENQHEGNTGILCTGSLQRDYKNKAITTSDYMRDTEFIGFKLTIDDITPYKFITYYGQKITNHGQPTVYIYNMKGEVIAQNTDNYHNIGNEWEQYVIDVTSLTGKVFIIFNGGYVDSTGSAESKYIFSDVVIY